MTSCPAAREFFHRAVFGNRVAETAGPLMAEDDRGLFIRFARNLRSSYLTDPYGIWQLKPPEAGR